MRLIDADARVTVQSFDVEHEEYEHTEMSVAEALDFATDEGCPPTIEAIPMEWLYDKRFRSVYVLGQQNPTLEVGINIVLNEWRKEQEVR